LAPVRAIAHFVLVAAVAALACVACKRHGDDPEPPAPPGTPGVDPRLVIAVDRRVELVSVVARLAELEEYSKRASTPYMRAVDEHFAAWRDHPAVAAMRALRAEKAIGYNAVVGLGVYLDEHFAPRRPLVAPLPGLDARWDTVDMNAFVFELQDFARVSGFDAFFASQAPYFAKVEARVRGVLDGYRVVDWFETLFGPRDATFLVVPGLLTGDHAYGAFSVDAARHEQIVQVLFLPPGGNDGLPHPDRATIYTLIHEFGHSYVNPALDAHPDIVLPAMTPLFEKHQKVMARQNYPNATIVADESVVRALVVLYARDRGARGAEPRRVAAELRSSFFWTPQVAAAIDAARTQATPLSPESLARAAQAGFSAYASR
jgi:hypothetical protein